MRIIAGTLKGRRLTAPTWPGLRPTSDRLRETLFNVIRDRVAGARVLDGFAGTGAIGIEALSRGAAHVTFVERDPRACRLIADNLQPLGLDGRYTIACASVTDALARPGRAFDLVVLDPPYDDLVIDAAVTEARRALTPGGVLVLEHASRRAAPSAGGVAPYRSLRAGDSALAFYAAEPRS